MGFNRNMFMLQMSLDQIDRQSRRRRADRHAAAVEELNRRMYPDYYRQLDAIEAKHRDARRLKWMVLFFSFAVVVFILSMLYFISVS